MVREARFCWDDSDGREPPFKQDRMDDFDDDELLDPDPPLSAAARRSPKQSDKPKRRSKGRRRAAESDRRHLAGADWLRAHPAQDEDEAA